MKTTIARRQFEFCEPQLDTLLLVEETSDEVVVRATRNTFSAERKAAFVRRLASEGFISDSFRWYSSVEPRTDPRVRRVIDHSWLQIGENVRATARRFMVRLLVSAAVLWVLLLASLALSSRYR